MSFPRFAARLHPRVPSEHYINSLRVDLDAVNIDLNGALEDTVRLNRRAMSDAEQAECLKRIRRARARLTVIERLLTQDS